MSTNYILIDYENVQPQNLDILSQHSFKIIVFVGENQTKLHFDLVAGLQAFGSAAKYVKISGNGNNALDFHIAYYIGRLAAEEPDAYFHIISKDTGFDPLIKHLRTNKVRVHRETDLAEIPVLKISNTTSKEETINAIVKNLAGRGQSRPRKVKTLTNTINSLFDEKLDNKEMMSLLQSLKDRKYILVNETNVSYRLPKQA
ncbi:conserved hypothetical protein [Desulforapulum autotrophicum HRM2]|uniref:PIN-like domain-containing protein n=1 Tax=Desulforapulum autotrophicum (strain ATCC 43914 / DSM 3382 / VKM B-1955 / HRM2) TaxID=177437 RepID=C0QC22_DESAH|nr:PIN domain-containing protein [Desulforapulum autotrophicum]ACN15034.1 conserved hypothetical protein [Desulforapulum autotrophicum HRM2]